MKRKRFLALALAGALGLSMAGCGGGSAKKDIGEESTAGDAKEESDELELSEAAKNHADDGEEIIGISMPAQNLERWNRDGAYLKKEFEKQGYTVDLKFADNKIDTQIEDLHNLVNDGIDILLLAPVDGTTLAEALEEYKAADVPIIAYDRITESDAVEYYVSFDNYMVGQLEGEYIRDTLDLDNAKKKSYNLEIVSGYSADKNADGYYYGAHDLLEPYIKAGTLVIPSGEESYSETETFQWSSEYARERVTNILTAYYADGTRLDAVLCANDSAAVGVAQAIEAEYQGKNQPLLTGQDGDEENLKNIMDGKQSMTVYKCLPHETEAAADLTVAFMKGEDIDESLIKKSKWDFDVVFAPERYSNGTNNMKSFLLTPLTITKDNIQSELIDTGFYEMGDDGYPKAVN